MSVETRAYDKQHDDEEAFGPEPVVVMVVTGTHDVSRLVNMLARGNCEQVGYAAKLLRQLRRHNCGQAALRLLAQHGGPDFTEPPSAR